MPYPQKLTTTAEKVGAGQITQPVLSNIQSTPYYSQTLNTGRFAQFVLVTPAAPESPYYELQPLDGTVTLILAGVLLDRAKDVIESNVALPGSANTDYSTVEYLNSGTVTVEALDGVTAPAPYSTLNVRNANGDPENGRVTPTLDVESTAINAQFIREIRPAIAATGNFPAQAAVWEIRVL